MDSPDAERMQSPIFTVRQIIVCVLIIHKNCSVIFSGDWMV